MIPTSLSQLANHLWQSTLFVTAVWLLTLALGKNRAAVRYRLWLAASVKFLIPFSLLVSLGSHLELRTRRSVAQVPFALAIDQISHAFTVPVASDPLPAGTPPSNPVPVLLFAVWLCGFAATTIVWLRWWHRFRMALRSATPLHLDLPIPVMASSTRLEPGVFGICKPVILLPEGITNRLTPGQLQAIFAHELCHVRRRDNLAAAIHMMVESIFWFHPLVWWIGARLAEERERACDEDVIRLGAEPYVYAEGILNICKFYLQSPPCASGVTGADLKMRIEAIVSRRISHNLTVAKKLMLSAAGLAAIGAPVLIGLWSAPSAPAQSRERLVFEVASIKRLDPNTLGPEMGLGFELTPSGGILARLPVKMLITSAYRIDDAQLSGGPSWISSELYDIQAKPEKFEGTEDQPARPTEQMENGMRERLKALLADRFRLAVRTETKEAPVYVLSIAKGGHKLTPDPKGGGMVRGGGGRIESNGAPISYLVHTLTSILGRPVLDETGLDGEFTYKLEFRPEGFRPQGILGGAVPPQPAPEDAPRPSIFAAIVQQLGLQLQSMNGPATTLIIERIERPTEN